MAKDYAIVIGSTRDSFEYMLMFADTVGAAVNEVCMPLITLLFGDLINSLGDNENNNDVVKAVSMVSLKFVYLAAGAGVAAFLRRGDIVDVADGMSGDTVPIQDAMGEKIVCIDDQTIEYYVWCESLLEMGKYKRSIKVGTLEHRHRDADTFFHIPWGGEFSILIGLQRSQLGFARVHPEEDIKRRMLVFVAGPCHGYLTEYILKIGKRLKENNIALDVVSFPHQDLISTHS
ncbi:ABC transporter B family member 4-like protein [Tanacetum coccineum]